MIKVFESLKFPECYYQTNACKYRYPIDLHKKFFSWIANNNAAMNADILKYPMEFSNGEKNTLLCNAFCLGGDCGWANYAMDTALKILSKEEIDEKELNIGCKFCPHAWSIEKEKGELILENGGSTCYGGRLYKLMLLKNLNYILNFTEGKFELPFTIINSKLPRLNETLRVNNTAKEYYEGLLEKIFGIPKGADIAQEIKNVCEEIINLPVKEDLQTIEEGNG